jgi:hypothetical protein
MFCPRCSNEILSERARFCTRCSFPLATVQELVETETAKSKAEEEKKNYPLRQPDISLGAGLMTIGLIKAILIMSGFGWGGRGELLILTLALGMFFGAALMLLQLSPRQRGLTLGATMIFLGSLIGVLAGLAGGGPPALFIFPRREYSIHSRQAWMEMRGATRYPALRCTSAVSR